MSAGGAALPATAARAAAPHPARAGWRSLFAVVLVSTWCGNQFSPLLLMYERIEHYPAVMVNLFLGVYVLGLVPSLLIAGALSDRRGRRPVMTAGVLVSLAASATLALGPLGTPALIAGRLLSGVTVGIAMAVGNTWLKEVSQPPHDPGADAAAGARRASLAFTLGSAAGAVVAGGIAQWGPWKEELPFVVHIAATLPCLWLVRRVPETRTAAAATGGSPLSRLRVPAAGHRRFLRVVLPCAPWLFATAGLAYGYLPVLLAPSTGQWGLAYATALNVVTMGTAALVQPLAKRLHSPAGARALVIAMLLTVAGLAVVDAGQRAQSPLIGAAAGVVLGAGIGVGLVSGLQEVQRIAGPRDLAGLTGVFYALAYGGFLLPTVMAALTPPFTTSLLMAILLVLAALSCAAVLVSYRKHLPPDPEVRTGR